MNRSLRRPRLPALFAGPAAALALALMLLQPLAAVAATVPVVPLAEAAKRLSAGGYVLLMRHSATRPDVGEGQQARDKDCAAKPELSAEGLAHAGKLGAALKEAGIRIDDVSVSNWCRSQETAQAAFGSGTVWPALNFFHANLRGVALSQGRELVAGMGYVKAPKNAVWVTQQVNITSLTGFVPAGHEILAVRLVKGEPQAEFRFNPLP